MVLKKLWEKRISLLIKPGNRKWEYMDRFHVGDRKGRECTDLYWKQCYLIFCKWSGVSHIEEVER